MAEAHIEMIEYTELDLNIAPIEPWRDVIIAELGDMGFDSFEETPTGVRAYVPVTRLDKPAVLNLLTQLHQDVRTSHTFRTIAPRNWNSQWERSFQPVEVGRDVRIRAKFHEPVPGFAQEIVITPRMAFGTGHHATTRMMVMAMLDLARADARFHVAMEGRHVCDLGCGTAVLAILAERLGAGSVEAIDIDEQAVVNARENLVLNGCQRVVVDKGDATRLRPDSCTVILANIERNTLLRDMLRMSDALQAGGALLLSGFVQADASRMIHAVKAAGLTPAEHLTQGEWALIGCRK